MSGRGPIPSGSVPPAGVSPAKDGTSPPHLAGGGMSAPGPFSSALAASMAAELARWVREAREALAIGRPITARLLAGYAGRVEVEIAEIEGRGAVNPFGEAEPILHAAAGRVIDGRMPDHRPDRAWAPKPGITQASHSVQRDDEGDDDA